MVDDETDPGNTVTSVVNLTRTLLQDVLHQHGITLQPHVSLRTHTAVIKGVLDLQDYEGIDDILKTAQRPGDPVERFCELLALVSPHPVEFYLPDIEFVSQMLLQRVIENAEQEQLRAIDEEDRVFRAGLIARFRNFVNFCKRHGNPTPIQQLVHDGVDAGYPFELYIGLIGRDFEEMPIEDAIETLLGMAMLSSDGHHDPEAVIAARLETLVSDADIVMKISVGVRNKLLEFVQNEQS